MKYLIWFIDSNDLNYQKIFLNIIIMKHLDLKIIRLIYINNIKLIINALIYIKKIILIKNKKTEIN